MSIFHQMQKRLEVEILRQAAKSIDLLGISDLRLRSGNCHRNFPITVLIWSKPSRNAVMLQCNAAMSNTAPIRPADSWPLPQIDIALKSDLSIQHGFKCLQDQSRPQ